MNREELQRIQNLLEEWLTDDTGNPVWSEIVSGAGPASAADDLLQSLLGGDGGVDLGAVLDTLGQLPGLTEQCIEQLETLRQVHSRLPEISRRCADVTALLERARGLLRTLREDEQPEMEEDEAEADAAAQGPHTAGDEAPELEMGVAAAVEECEEDAADEAVDRVDASQENAGQEEVDATEERQEVEAADAEDSAADEEPDSPEVSAGEMLDDLGAMEQDLDRCREVRERAVERVAGEQGGSEDAMDEEQAEEPVHRSSERGRSGRYEPRGTCLGGGGYKDITRVFDDLYGRIAPRPVESPEGANPWEDEIEDAAGAKNTFGNRLLSELDEIELLFDEQDGGRA